MLVQLRTISDRLLDTVAPKTSASAADCWQSECIRRRCLGRTTTLMWYEVCEDYQEVGYCGCRM
ncbi:hypothetical protein AB0M39_01895 [Streptomyces sp. NPDC051907]|uniref:hypothetical protein n=1 Tax=Streptomyces sp. NPDC051907 TaxID=3155284 RepID=UPI0034379818